MREKEEKHAVPLVKNSKVPTAYLSQQISQLQDKVGGVSIGNPRGWNIPVQTNLDEHEFPALGAEPRPKRDTSREPAKEELLAPATIARIDDSGGESAGIVEGWGNGSGQGRKEGATRRGRQVRDRREQVESSADEEDDERAWRVVVLDTSALLWAPQGVRQLVRQGWEIIIPAEALRTLDLLKSGSAPSARAARAATRWIEHASKHYSPANGRYAHGRGVRIQQDDETSPPDSVSTLPIPVIDGDVLPKWMEAILGCAAFFMTSRNADDSDGESIASIADLGPTLCVANPPLSVEVEEGFTGNIGQRGEGYLISQEAERYEIPIEVLRDDEDDLDEMKGKRAQRGRGKPTPRGRGGGRNGHGNRAKEESPEREVKILLRRPEPEDKLASPLLAAPELSSPSSAHRSPLPEPPRVGAPPRSPQLPPAFVPRDPSSPRPAPPTPGAAKQPPPSSPRGRFGHNERGSNDLAQREPSRSILERAPRGPRQDDVPPPRSTSTGRPTQQLYNPPSHRTRADTEDSSNRGRGGMRGGRGRGMNPGGPARGGRGAGRGGRGGQGGHGPVSGEFVLLQRPGPPPAEERMGGGSSGPKVVLLQRPK